MVARLLAAAACGLLGRVGWAAPVTAPSVEVVGPWSVRVSPGTVRVGRKAVAVKARVDPSVSNATLVSVSDERYENLPIYEPQVAPWARGARLKGVVTSETTAPDSLVPESVVVKSAPGAAQALVRGRDYDLEPQWGTFGRIAGGLPVGATVYVDYRHGLHRIDTIAVNGSGRVSLRQGKPHNATPKPPTLGADEVAIANLWVPARLAGLGADNVFPIVEPTYRPPTCCLTRGASSREASRSTCSRGATASLPEARRAALRTAGRTASRSEERRVGKECRSRWSPYH